MQFPLLSTVLLALTTLAAAAPTPAPLEIRADDSLDVFTLHAVSPAQAGPAEWLSTDTASGNQSPGGPLGWWKSSKGTDLTAFVQFEKKAGVVFDSLNTVRSLWLRPDGRVYLGGSVTEEGKNSDETPWTITKRYGSTKEWFGVKGASKGWVLCSGSSGKSLYWDPKDAKKCTKLDGLEVVYN